MHLDSIRARMTAAFTVSIALLMLLVCGGFIIFAHYAAERNAAERLQNAARKIQSELVNREGVSDTAELLEEERDLVSDNLVLAIYTLQGNLLKQSQKRVPPFPAHNDAHWRVIQFPNGKNLAVIGLPWGQTRRGLQAQVITLILIGVLVVGASAVGAWILVGRTLSPIDRLACQVQSASADNLALVLSAPSQDAEIVGLVATLNDLLHRLAQTAEAKGRFYAAASHELRTPLQALSGHLELSLSKERTTEERHATIAEAYTQTQRLTVLVRDLLTLNRLEFAEVALPKEVIRVSDICRQMLRQFVPLIEHRGLKIETLFGERDEVDAPPRHIEILVRNLIENALKYATENGAVTLQTESDTLTIRNDFFSAVPLNTILWFEPFYRPDAARNSETGGNGLGLAICKIIAQTNGWQIDLTHEENQIQCRVRFR